MQAARADCQVDRPTTNGAASARIAATLKDADFPTALP
jgi:hypothetical protein